MLKSRYAAGQMVIVLFAALFFSFIGVLLYIHPGKGQPSAFLCVFLSVIGFCFPFAFLERCPRLRFDEKFITVRRLWGTDVYDWASVNSVRISSKENFVLFFIFSQNWEAATIEMQDRSKVKIWDQMYGNRAELISYVVGKVPVKVEDAPVALNKRLLEMPGTMVFKGNPFTSFNTLLFSGMGIFFIVLVASDPKRLQLFWIPIIFLVPFGIATGTQMYYFEIGDGELVVRNHYFSWFRRSYPLQDIRELVIESPYRRSNALRIIGNNYGSKKYSAGSLRDRHWRELMDTVTAMGIPVRSDVYLSS